MSNLLDTLDPIFAECVRQPWEPARSSYDSATETPWIANGWAYAANQEIIVRQRVRRKDTVGRFPKCAGFFRRKAGKEITLPRLRGKQGKPKAVDIGSAPIGLSDRYVRLLQRHGITTVRPTTVVGRFAFGKGKIQGLVMGRRPDSIAECVEDGDG